MKVWTLGVFGGFACWGEWALGGDLLNHRGTETRRVFLGGFLGFWRLWRLCLGSVMERGFEIRKCIMDLEIHERMRLELCWEEESRKDVKARRFGLWEFFRLLE